MNKRIRIAAVLAAAMLSLTACGDSYGIDYSKKYADYFAYCFGDDYEFDKIDRVLEESNSGKYRYSVYSLTYRDNTGARRINNNVISENYKDLPAADRYGSQEYFEDCSLEDIVFSEISSIAKEELVAQIAAPYLDVSYDADALYMPAGKDAELSVIVFTPIYGLSDSEAVRALAQAHIVPGTGWQACTANLKTVAQDAQWNVQVLLRLKDSADAAVYQQKLEQIRQQYLAYTEAPVNYTFILRQESGEESSTLFSEYVLLGEEIDYEAEKQKDEHFTVNKALLAHFAGE